jgi:hypothetical protein
MAGINSMSEKKEGGGRRNNNFLKKVRADL